MMAPGITRRPALGQDCDAAPQPSAKSRADAALGTRQEKPVATSTLPIARRRRGGVCQEGTPES